MRQDFRDPSAFPCQVAGCEMHAEGWVVWSIAEALDLSIDSHTQRVFLCVLHLGPLKEGKLPVDEGLA